ncbi:MAG TPA: alpha/beta hydrolase [Thermohalobaculum sp.]|nr:alpha/beta hydrolase [Thermohalobaculum sp.]
MLLAKLAAAAAALYLAVILALALAQDRLLFPRWAVEGAAIPLPPAAARLSLAAGQGARLAGLHIPPERPPPEAAALILGFGGNAWDGDALALTLHRLFPDRHVVAFHYRGYGPSTGSPSAEALMADALAVHDHVAETLAPARVVAVGLSIGAGPAAWLASRRPLAGLILVTPFDSLRALARHHYPWAPVGLVLRHRMEVAEAVAGTAAPVALIAAERDTIVPPARSAPLRAAAADLVLDRTIEDAGHNDLYERAAFAEAMREALRRIEAR